MDIVKIFEEYAPYIYSYSLKLTRNISDAEDLTQETFIRAIDKIDQLKNPNSIKYWLRTICFNRYLMDRRKGKDFVLKSNDLLQSIENFGDKLISHDISPSFDDELIVEESIKKVQAACFLAMVHRMKENQRIIFSLIDMFGLTTHEVSEMMLMSESAVKSHLHRARKKLDNFLLNTCDLIDKNNPCNCKAWKDFVLSRERIKSSSRKYNYSDSNSNNFTDESSRELAIKKIRKLYSEMPEYKPSREWYEKIIRELRKILR